MQKGDSVDLNEERDERLNELYHSEGGYVGAKTLLDIIEREGLAPSKLKITENYINNWLKKQEIYRLHKAAPLVPKGKIYRPFMTQFPNQLHMYDLVVMPEDPSGYIYFLSLIDVHTRYAACVPLKRKDAKTVLNTIYKVLKQDEYLSVPKKINIDMGPEFNNKLFKKFADDNNIIVRYGAVGDHKHISIVERFNKTMEVPIFKRQYEIEARNKRDFIKKNGEEPRGKELDDLQNKEWVNMLLQQVWSYNNRTHSSIGISPTEAMQDHKNIVTGVRNKKYMPDTNPMIDLGSFVITRVPRGSEMDSRATDPTFDEMPYIVNSMTISNGYYPRMYELRYIEANGKAGEKVSRWFYYEWLQVVDQEYVNLALEALKASAKTNEVTDKPAESSEGQIISSNGTV